MPETERCEKHGPYDPEDGCLACAWDEGTPIIGFGSNHPAITTRPAGVIRYIIWSDRRGGEDR